MRVVTAGLGDDAFHIGKRESHVKPPTEIAAGYVPRYTACPSVAYSDVPTIKSVGAGGGGCSMAATKSSSQARNVAETTCDICHGPTQIMFVATVEWHADFTLRCASRVCLKLTIG